MDKQSCETKGGKWEENKCSIKEISKIPKDKKEYFGFLSRSRKNGIVLLVIVALLWIFRPAQICAWYNIFCWLFKAITPPIFMVICGILVIAGLYKLVKG